MHRSVLKCYDIDPAFGSDGGVGAVVICLQTIHSQEVKVIYNWSNICWATCIEVLYMYGIWPIADGQHDVSRESFNVCKGANQKVTTTVRSPSNL